MSKRFVFLTMLVFCLLTSGLIWRGATSTVRGSSQAMPVDASKDVHPLDRINEKARSTKGGNQIAIRELTDVIFNVFDFAEIPSTALDQMKDRLVRAEINYRAKGKGGVTEKNITKMVNKLADTFGAPSYAKIDTVQVRQMRVSMMMRLPKFISSEVTNGKDPKKNVGSSIKTEMSPLEGAYLAMFILQQKMSNKAYQVTPQEWRANLHKKQMERWEAFRANKDNSAGSQNNVSSQQRGAGLGVDEENPKRDEMNQVISRTIASKGAFELKSLADTSLDDLGIAR